MPVAFVNAPVMMLGRGRCEAVFGHSIIKASVPIRRTACATPSHRARVLIAQRLDWRIVMRRAWNRVVSPVITAAIYVSQVRR